MALLDNGDLEEFLLFVCNFNMTLVASQTLGTGARVQYLRTLFRVEALHHFDSLSTDMEGKKPLTVENIILVVAG